MGINSLVQSQENVELAALAIEGFINKDLTEAAPYFNDPETEIYLACLLAPDDEMGRRVVVVSDQHSTVIRVCIAAIYELFEGDVHHFVQRIGTVNRDEAATALTPLVRQAYQRLIDWKPIWDYVF